MGKNLKFNKVFVKAVAWGSVLTLTAGAMTGCSTKKTDVDTDTTTDTTTDKTKYENGDTKPNVIYIVLDDIGFSDLGCYGSEIKTPNIDALAQNGIRYNNFNTCPLSSPTRASLLTGRENNSVGMGNVANVSLGEDRPNIQGRVIDEAGMVSEILQEEGFNTYGIGKWHLAPAYTVNPAGPFDYWPTQKGFDRFYGFMDGETDQYNPQLVSGNELISAPDTEGYNVNDDLVNHAIQYITDQVSLYPDQPFFMNYAFGTGHSPLQVAESYIDMYDGVYDKGWDVVRQERFERQISSGIIPADTQLASGDETVAAWDSMSEDEKKLSIRFMQTYAGFMTQADEEVGKLINYLKETGEYDNTMIVLIGDNGATNSGGPMGTDSFMSALTGGRVATVNDLLPKIDEIGGPNMQALYPKGWAQVSNTPFDTYKGSVYAGALRNPLIISWPAGIKEGGTIRNQYVHVTDITPTVLDILEFEVPETINGVKQMPMYGTSIASTFEDANAKEVRTTAITYLQPNRAIYSDGWKAIATHTNGKSFDEDVWELYNVKEDYTESVNLAKKESKKLDELKKLFMSEAEKYKILPLKEGSVADMAFVRPDSPANRTSFKFYPGVGTLLPAAAPQINTNSFAISATITRNSNSDEGVIAAMGDEIGGYSFYIINNKLIFLYNKFSTIYSITSNIDVPVGEVNVKFDFVRSTIFDGTGTLYINDVNVGSADFVTAPVVTFEGLSIGMDKYKPVSTDYEELGDFPFTGKLSFVQYDISPIVPKK